MRCKLSIIVSFFALFASATLASEFLSTNDYTVAADQTVADEQWVMSNTAKTEGTFKNDLFITSYTDLLLKGTYEGNVWGAAGSTATLSGECRRNVRITGQTLRIDGHIGGNLMAMANNIIIGKTGVVDGNVRLIGSSVVIEGTVNGKAKIVSARVATLTGTFGGNADVVCPEILLTANAHFKGNLTYTSNQELLPPNNVVEGKLVRVVPKPPPLLSAARARSHAMWFLAACLAGVPFITTFPMTTAMASLLARKAPFKCLAVGFAASFLLPFFGVMCVSSFVGLPLGALIIASWGILVYVSRIVMGLMIGTLILKTGGTSVGRVLLAMFSGLAIIYLATLIPTIGLPVQLAVVWVGMGSLMLALLQKRRLIIQVPEELKHLEELRKQQNKSTEE